MKHTTLTAAFALLLVVSAGTASAQGLVIGGTQGASVTPGVLPGTPAATVDSYVVSPGSDRCGSSGVYEPLSPATVQCLQSETREYLWERYQIGSLKPATNLSQAQVQVRIMMRSIPVKLFAWSNWIESAANATQPFQGCAAGIAYPNEIWVSLRDGDERSRKLVAWETANNILAWGLGRHDLGDSAEVVGGAANRAYAVCSSLPYAIQDGAF